MLYYKGGSYTKKWYNKKVQNIHAVSTRGGLLEGRASILESAAAFSLIFSSRLSRQK